ncbi:MAG: ATP-dependent helicase, partial [Rhodocyclaceae bacterium]|nr:ATP-dependent helicase [Rhodocyclaceae bacterium]
CPEERGKLAEIEKLIKRPIEQVLVQGFEPGPDFDAAADRGRRGRGGAGRAERGESSREKPPAPRREPRRAQ